MDSEKRMSIIRHFIELRRTILISAFAIAIGVVIGWFIYVPLFKFLIYPVAELENIQLVTTSITEPIMVKLKVSFLAGILIALPVVLWQIWGFVFPGFKKNERKIFVRIVPVSILLFIFGVVFAFYVVLPVAVKFLLFINSGVYFDPLVSQSSYLSFILKLLLCFGIGFELPIAILLAVRLNLITPKWLKEKRKYALIFIMFLVFLISPTPDIPSQLLMVGPFYMLYEVSIWLSFLVIPNRKRVNETSVEV